MKEVDLVQGSEPWLVWRMGKVTASEAPIIMGHSPYTTRQELWRLKMGLDEPKEQTFAMRRGNDLEPMIREMMSDNLGCLLVPRVFESGMWMSASVDGIDIEQNIVVEIKCANAVDHSMAQRNICPPKYFAQLQHILSVLGMDVIYYCSYHKGDLVYFPVERNKSYIDTMIRQEEEFWNSLQNFQKPEITAEHKEKTKEEKIYAERNDEEWSQLSLQWQLIQAQKKAILEEEEELKSRMISLSGGVNTRGNGLTLTLHTRIGAISYADIMELQGIDLEKYRKKPTTFWMVKNDAT